MTGELWAERASSFGSVAASYAEHRPGYPAVAVRWALERAPGKRVLDLGAGTGKLTEALVQAGASVQAVEPDPEMLAELRRRLPNVDAASGSAEELPLVDGAVDAVLVGQAFHWFTQERALPEIARVLRPGGALALTGNEEDDGVPWVAGLVEVVGSVRAPELQSTGRSVDRLPEHPAFAGWESDEFRWTWSRTVDGYVDTVATHSWALLTPPAERASALATIRAHLAAVHPSGAFDLPMLTRVARCRRG